MNIYVPFICLTLGAVINWRGLPQSVLKVFDIATKDVYKRQEYVLQRSSSCI